MFWTHSKCPVMPLGDVTWIDRSTAARSATGAVKVTTTGWATPTTAPSAGKIEATRGVGCGRGTAAVLRPTGATRPTAVIATITNR